MTQPPYGPPGPCQPYRPPAGFGPYGPPPRPPKKNNLLPWLIVGGALLFSGLGLLLVVQLRGGGGNQAADTSATITLSSAAGTSASAHAGLPGGAQLAEEDTSAHRSRYAGSGDVARAWVQAMADGEFQAAYDISCADVQQASIGAAAGEDPAATLGTYFLEQTLGGRGFTDGSLNSVIYDQDSDSDIGSFTLHLDDGQEFLLLVYVQADGKVCDFA